MPKFCFLRIGLNGIVLPLVDDDRDRADGPALTIADDRLLRQLLPGRLERDDVLARLDQPRAASEARERGRLLARAAEAACPS